MMNKTKFLFPLFAGAVLLAPLVSMASLPPSSLSVDVSIRPFGEPNSINPLSHGVIPVAILGSDDFDVSEIDGSSLIFGPAEASLVHPRGPHYDDVNDDGYTDLVSHHRTLDTGIAFGDTEACIRGVTLDGRPFEGCDAIRTVPTQ